MARPFCRKALAEGGERDQSDFVFFYGHSDSAGDVAVLSNWYVLPEPFVDGSGNRFRTSEHYMMHGKAVLFGDDEMAARILAAESASEAKKLGRKVRNFDEAKWAERRVALVADGCTLKFSQCSRCSKVLLDTGDKIIVEAAPRDRVWGIGMGRNNMARLNPQTWRGENLLGEALMVTRQRVREAGGGNTVRAGN